MFELELGLLSEVDEWVVEVVLVVGIDFLDAALDERAEVRELLDLPLLASFDLSVYLAELLDQFIVFLVESGQVAALHIQPQLMEHYK